MRALLLLVLLAMPGCAAFGVLRIPFVAPAPVAIPAPVTCGDLSALAAAVVDGRRRGQSRFEQRLFVAGGGPAEAFHRGVVEAVYDWPRPTSLAGWTRLMDASVSAASAHCLARPAAALRGNGVR